MGSEFGKRTNSGAKTPNLRFLGIKFSKLSLTLSPLWANFQVQVVDLQSKDLSKAEQKEDLGKIEEKLQECQLK